MDSRLVGSLVGQGKVAEVREYGDRVLKLYKVGLSAKRSAFREAATLAIIESLGVRAPRVESVCQYEGRWGLIMSRAAGSTFAEAIRSQPDRTAAHLEAMVRLHGEIHDRDGYGLPSLKARLTQNIEAAPFLTNSVRLELLETLRGMPGGCKLCHGDFHPWNVLGTPADATIVDWLDATCGEPAADICRSYVLMHNVDPKLGREYLATWLEMNGEAVERVYSWLGIVAAARLAEDVPSETDALLRMIRESSSEHRAAASTGHRRP